MMVEPDVDYPISFGDTMQGMPAEYCTLRYRDDFKPVHACRSGTAAFQLDGVQARPLRLSDPSCIQEKRHGLGNFP